MTDWRGGGGGEYGDGPFLVSIVGIFISPATVSWVCGLVWFRSSAFVIAIVRRQRQVELLGLVVREVSGDSVGKCVLCQCEQVNRERVTPCVFVAAWDWEKEALAFFLMVSKYFKIEARAHVRTGAY